MSEELQAVYDSVQLLLKECETADNLFAVARRASLKEVLDIIIAVGIADPEY